AAPRQSNRAMERQDERGVATRMGSSGRRMDTSASAGRGRRLPRPAGSRAPHCADNPCATPIPGQPEGRSMYRSIAPCLLLALAACSGPSADTLADRAAEQAAAAAVGAASDGKVRFDPAQGTLLV